MAEAIQYAVDSGAHVINVSLGIECHSHVLEWAVNYAYERGVVVVGSAGNENVAEVRYPARFADVIAVAAVDNDNVKASFSNYGVDVTVAAPGVDIYSTYSNGGFAWWSGTSQATPMVAGEAALLISTYPWMSVSEVTDVITQTAVNIDALNAVYDWTSILGSGRVDMLAAVTSNPAPHEFLVNRFIVGSQTTFSERPQAVATDAAGNFVVTWSSYQDTHGNNPSPGIYAQRYDTAGVPQGPEFRVNSTTAGDQLYSTVAMDAVGDFVVTWSSLGQDGSGWGIYAQRYNASGVPQGGEFRVNTTTSSNQMHSTVAMDTTGNFVVVWSGKGQDNANSWGVYAQRYDAAGVPQGGEFQVNTTTKANQMHSTVAMNATGNFVITWSSYGQDSGRGWGVYAQRYDAAGVPQGSEFLVNTTTADNQVHSSVTMDAASDFVIAWYSNGQDGSGRGIYAQRFDAAGMPQGDEFRVNTTTTGDQEYPSVAMDTLGNLVVTWLSDGSVSGSDVYAQRYDAAGVPQGGEFRVNTLSGADLKTSSAAMDADGDLVVVWSGNGPGDIDGVFGQLYE